MALILLSSILISLFGVWYIYKSARSKASHVPLVEFDGDNSPARYETDTVTVLLGKGYKEYTKKDLPFRIHNPFDPKQPLIVLPFKYMDEVKWAPESRFSFWDFIDKLGSMTQLGIPLLSHEGALSAKIGLNKALGSKIKLMQDACVGAFEKLMPDCAHEWAEVAMPYMIIMQVFANMSAWVFVGEEIGSRESEWQKLTLGYVNKVNSTLAKVRARYPASLLWLCKYLDSDVKSMARDRQKAGELLRKPLEARLAASQGQLKSERGSRHFEDGVQWLADIYMDRGEEVTPDMIQQKLVTLVFASIHSTSGAALTILLDMLAHPEATEEVRQEVDRVRLASSGTWTRQTLSELRLLDSFMRESARFHAFAQVLSLQRMAQVPWTFSDGFSIPAGAMIAFPGYHQAHDPDLHPEPERFDPKRHLRKREAYDGDSQHFRFTSVNDDLLHFGSGLHACPGRFFAQESLKLILVHLLTNYEFKVAEKDKEVPKMVVRNLVLKPNMALPILFRERRA
ncbi:cytochrome P450 monooxygenase [Naviculisporaceae sp. PSN 640]